MADLIPVNNFTSGELAETLAGRVDLSKYFQGCSLLKNFKVNPHGGVVKRTGFKLLESIPGEALLIPFVFNRNQAYCLAFMENKLRFFTKDGVILKDGAPYEIDSPYTLAQAKDMSFIQSADTLFLACWMVPPTRLIRKGHDEWEFETMSFDPPLPPPEWEPIQTGDAPLYVTRNQSSVANPDYDADDPESGPQFFKRYQVVDRSGGDPDDYEDISETVHSLQVDNPDGSSFISGALFVNGAVKSDGSTSPAQLTTPLSYYVSAVTDEEKESELSEAATVTGPGANNWQGGDYVKLAWQAVEGAASYRIYKAEYHGRPGFIGSTTGLEYVDHNIVASISEGSPRYIHPFAVGLDDEGEVIYGYPGVVGLFEQRLIFASSDRNPQALWLSKSGDDGNFAVYEPMMDDSSIQLTLASSEMSSFAWLAPLRSMIVGTASMEWEITASAGAFTVKTAKATPQSYIGSAKLPPIIVGNSLLHVSGSGNKVRNLKYDFGSDSYGGTDLSILANHLFRDETIVDWSYQKYPDSIIWCVGSGGGLYGLTYMEDHQIAAWHRHETAGKFLSVCSIPGGHDDSLFVVTSREGSHYVEMMALESAEDKYNVYLDCASIYDGPETSVISGLDHLEGREIGLLVDGAVLGREVVSGGKVTLQRPGSVVVAGLPYEATLRTMPLELASGQGATLGRKKVVNAVNVMFHATRGAEAQVEGYRGYEFKWRADENYGVAPKAFTGVKRITVPSSGETSLRIVVAHDYPTPCHVLAMMPEIAVL
jgi:hypothetical protein